ncbi:hypothetical protein SAMN06265795_115128 [Noviherbaspirillum humi]|uniref:YXWGXW repeat-containing protein n=1 Tax=Noviherbaspirillum humi TaxID=1688639 RepID=A0A239KE78_9BURK|nr:hypothetical protein [Noviherbaspirillum humi]SNT16355.1 hypothetical protein SAMN06265795_115128 [Noviherbaspirillum humi]
MIKSLRIALPAVLVLGLGAGNPAQADPPPWAPAHGHRAKEAARRQYNYVYYPAQQVYYAPDTRSWFWLNGGSWQVGVNLPVQFQGYVTSGVPVVLQTERPYTQHVYVEQNYGRPWREQHGHGNGHGHGHGHDKEKHKHKHDD